MHGKPFRKDFEQKEVSLVEFFCSFVSKCTVIIGCFGPWYWDQAWPAENWKKTLSCLLRTNTTLLEIYFPVWCTALNHLIKKRKIIVSKSRLRNWGETVMENKTKKRNNKEASKWQTNNDKKKPDKPFSYKFVWYFSLGPSVIMK